MAITADEQQYLMGLKEAGLSKEEAMQRFKDYRVKKISKPLTQEQKIYQMTEKGKIPFSIEGEAGVEI